jgi:hypothetical protein
MKAIDTVRVRGIFKLRVYKRGELIEDYEDHNLVVDVARVALARLVSGDAAASAITQIGFGTNGTAPAAGDTALTAPLLKAIASHSFPATGQVAFAWTLTTAEGNGKSIAEFGLVCADGSLFARKNRTAALAKDSDISLSGTWTIQF